LCKLFELVSQKKPSLLDGFFIMYYQIKFNYIALMVSNLVIT